MPDHILLVERLQDWKPHFPEYPVVRASDYLMSPEHTARVRLRVINLCRSHRYLSEGYYCSLLAEARGHKVVPSVRTLQDLSSKSIYGLDTEDIDRRVARVLGRHRSQPEPTTFGMNVFFGQCAPKEMQEIARQVFALFPVPMLRMEFRRAGQWRIESLRLLALNTLAEAEETAFFDALEHYLKCTNKVYLAERLAAQKVPTPRTLILRPETLLAAEEAIGYPVVLKIPDGSFSRGVFKACDRAEMESIAARLFQESDLILAQEFVYTPFDWRIGILNKRPLYACQYLMSRHHWQIVNHAARGRLRQGGSHTLAVEAAPPSVVKTALRAANLIGDGLYGVDLKETPRGVMVIEVNDNPSIDAGVEDAVLKDGLYRAILEDFVRRLDGARRR
ncbi:RimK family protein [Ectothiorhodospira mobilis]|uniref:RimK family protein n=1 Tax=Ectothiorhodospira mobilis TaxID=195064 RepID=UPI001EE7820B|nr:RimK family protein [Ectothiorhodospira mobilis]MCG5535875.1 RimK family protein [Ectothiorhodospira mobilis]